MRLVNVFGEDCPLEDLEPWLTFMEDDEGKHPITRIEYRFGSITIDWQKERPHEDRSRY